MQTVGEWLTPGNVFNTFLVCVIAYLLRVLLIPDDPPPPPRKERKPAKELPERDFTLEELRKYDGKTPLEEHDGETAIYIAVNGTVFDMSSQPGFYGPEGPYGGRSCPRNPHPRTLASCST